MKHKVFVDGQEGTTGLKIHEYLAQRSDIEWLSIDPEKRKDIAERSRLLNSADLVFLCLPDVAAREAVSLITNEHTRVIDASTAHRTHPDWAYGLPELSPEHREKIKHSRRVSVPGCHATGFIVGLYPLVKAGIVPADYPVTCTSLTGYSGGGKSLIKKYESVADGGLNSPRPYALRLQHKHLPEMQAVTGLRYPPAFVPVVANYYKGMGVMLPLISRLLNKPLSAAQVRDFFAEYFAAEKFIKVMPYDADATLEEGFFPVECCNDTNRIELFVFGNNEQILVVSRFDNLGKGASGAAVQCMNIMLGADEAAGLKS
ncbi:N-acetyl-gamma-glutamyl-phosphate reductase [Anaeroselena agilis]|uniref:N-acetyl-gamma-glutamyl-phosphate reductase n=1 Tax=Anaeroselena agilis TaxID=3063788 RepID=A0ABU3P2S4_9FIRM|nr:N-acetyl-gamma-glutamyl-phosphate reductase [Selenomonadales bacterium 4137-cl]